MESRGRRLGTFFFQAMGGGGGVGGVAVEMRKT